MGRMMIVINKPLEERVLKISAELRQTPNPFANACVESCLEVIEGGDPKAVPRIVDLYFRLTGRDEGRLLQSLSRAAARLVPELPTLEARFKSVFLNWMGDHLEEHGAMPSKAEAKKKMAEIGQENVELGKALKKQRKQKGE